MMDHKILWGRFKLLWDLSALPISKRCTMSKLLLRLPSRRKERFFKWGNAWVWENRIKIMREAKRQEMGKRSGLKTRFKESPRKHLGQMPKLKKLTGRFAASIKVHKNRNKDICLVLYFGSQYTQLIARRVRESKVYSQIVPFNISSKEIEDIKPKGIILSGGPLRVYDKGAPLPHNEIFQLGVPGL